jgi:hypothetical protein
MGTNKLLPFSGHCVFSRNYRQRRWGHTNFCHVVVTVLLAETIDKEDGVLPCLPLHRLWTFGDPFRAWPWIEKS